MNKLALKLNKTLYRLKPQHLGGYLLLVAFCSNLVSANTPMALAEDKSTADYNLIAISDAQNPNYDLIQIDADAISDPTIFIEPACASVAGCFIDKPVEPVAAPVMPIKIASPAVYSPLNGKTLTVLTTAYSSTPDQTDSSPFITANGTRVHDGIIACNFLPFGAKVKFPEYSGDKVYIVADRMAARNSHKMDIWMETRAEALQFGVRKLAVEVLE